MLLHIDAPVRRSLLGDDIFYFDNSDSQDSDVDKVLSLNDLNVVKRKVIIISENIMKLPDILMNSTFIFLPLKSSFWPHNPTLLLYSIEFLLYDFYTRNIKKASQKGRIENIVRIKAQIYFKFLSQLISPAIRNENFKYKWITECPIALMIFYNYLMSYYFLSWLEFEQKGIHLDIPIENLLPEEIMIANFRIYEFLKTMTGTD